MIPKSSGSGRDAGRNRAIDGFVLDPTVRAFWSVIVYDNQTRSMLQTDQQFPSVSSQTKGLKINTDGSVDVYFGPRAIAGEERTGRRTVPGKSWNIFAASVRPREALVRQDLAAR